MQIMCSNIWEVISADQISSKKEHTMYIVHMYDGITANWAAQRKKLKKGKKAANCTVGRYYFNAETWCSTGCMAARVQVYWKRSSRAVCDLWPAISWGKYPPTMQLYHTAQNNRKRYYIVLNSPTTMPVLSHHTK